MAPGSADTQANICRRACWNRRGALAPKAAFFTGATPNVRPGPPSLCDWPCLGDAAEYFRRRSNSQGGRSNQAETKGAAKRGRRIPSEAPLVRQNYWSG